MTPDLKDGKCRTESSPITVERGYHIWWCKTHERPLPWCNKDTAVKEAVEKLRKEIKRNAKPYCCHTTSMHNPLHFETTPEELCNIQKAQAFDRLWSFLKEKPLPMVNPNGCYWCQTEIERQGDDKK